MEGKVRYPRKFFKRRIIFETVQKKKKRSFRSPFSFYRKCLKFKSVKCLAALLLIDN